MEVVLNLVISGIPSILGSFIFLLGNQLRFKPCYKWNTFNTIVKIKGVSHTHLVLNLVISGIPSIQKIKKDLKLETISVLNLVISGIPSIQH